MLERGQVQSFDDALQVLNHCIIVATVPCRLCSEKVAIGGFSVGTVVVTRRICLCFVCDEVEVVEFPFSVMGWVTPELAMAGVGASTVTTRSSIAAEAPVKASLCAT